MSLRRRKNERNYFFPDFRIGGSLDVSLCLCVCAFLVIYHGRLKVRNNSQTVRESATIFCCRFVLSLLCFVFVVWSTFPFIAFPIVELYKIDNRVTYQ